MEKKLIVEFKNGKKVEINAAELANRIADIDSIDNHSDRVSELLNDEYKIFEAVWNMSWNDVCLRTSNECEPSTEGHPCLCKDWKLGKAKISVNW